MTIMFIRRIICSLSLFCVCAICQTNKSMSQKEACSKFMPAVVRIDVADGAASGFIVSSDGWIVTAGHVVIDERTGDQRHVAFVRLPDGTVKVAKIFIDEQSVIRDFAILKVEAVGLPFLELATTNEIEPGSELTLIGYPLSAEGPYSPSVLTKFCLSALVAATDTISYNGVNVDAVYFQGPAIKGLSGGALISRETGHVVGIQSKKMASIGMGLAKIRNDISTFQKNSQIIILEAGTNPTDDIKQLIDVLDRHLVNGLGVATGADDAGRFLAITQRAYKKNHNH